MRTTVVALFVCAAATCGAQSWTRADQIGVGRVKHWDDIPTQTSSPQQILDSLDHSEPAAPSGPAGPATSGAFAVPFYERRMLPETGALKSYFEELLTSKDEKIIKAASIRLQLPDSATWFSETFGSAAGAELEQEYSKLRAGWTTQFVPLIKGLRGRGQTAVTVTVVRGAGDPDASPDQRQVLAGMQRPTSLYTVRFYNPATRDQYVMHSFAYVDGAFRYVGKMKSLGAMQSQEPQPDMQPMQPAASPGAPVTLYPPAHQ